MVESARVGRTRWRAVILGWAVALFVGLVLGPFVRLLYGSISEAPIERGGITATLVVVSLVAGFVSYLVGGYVAAKAAGGAGGKHGALTAVVGLVVGLALAAVLAIFGVVFAGGVSLPPVGFGLAGAALLAGLVLFLTNLFGGFVGGKLGEPSSVGAHAGRPGAEKAGGSGRS